MTAEEAFFAGAVLIVGVLMVSLHVSVWRAHARINREIDEYERKHDLKDPPA